MNCQVYLLKHKMNNMNGNCIFFVWWNQFLAKSTRVSLTGTLVYSPLLILHELFFNSLSLIISPEKDTWIIICWHPWWYMWWSCCCWWCPSPRGCSPWSAATTSPYPASAPPAPSLWWTSDILCRTKIYSMNSLINVMMNLLKFATMMGMGRVMLSVPQIQQMLATSLPAEVVGAMSP